jgi:hypothetical protein
MEPMQRSVGVLDGDATPSQEALRLIVEVFQDGYRAAADLRRTARALTPGQLQVELQAIEQGMLSQISRICDNYQIQELAVARN